MREGFVGGFHPLGLGIICRPFLCVDLSFISFFDLSNQLSSLILILRDKIKIMNINSLEHT